MTATILVPVDGSAFAEQAVPHAVRLARGMGAGLRLVLVKEPVPGWASRAAGYTSEREAHAMERAYLDGLARRLQQDGTAVEAVLLDCPDAGDLARYAVEQGFRNEWLNRPVAAAIARHAMGHEVGLVVIATHGHGPVSRFWVGSVADQLLRQLPMPVLLVRPGHGPADPAPFRHILVPLDHSTFSEAVLDRVLPLGRLSGARYTLLHVERDHHLPFPQLAAAEAPYAPDPDGGSGPRYPADYLESVQERLRRQGIEAGTILTGGASPAAAILDAARALGVDLIAMTTHGASGLRRMMVGSVTERVVRGAEVPVLALRPAGQAAEPAPPGPVPSAASRP